MNYGVSIPAIKDFNGLSTDSVFVDQINNPIVHARGHTRPISNTNYTPPYQAPNLLLPADGAPFTLTNDTITLQWASIGTLRDNKSYQITVEE